MRLVPRYFCRWILIALVLGVVASGCSSLFQRFDEKVDRGRFGSDYVSLETAMELYDQGEIRRALDRFITIKLGSSSQKVAQRAWLGEICCRLILADTSAEFTTAVGMWHEFGSTMTDDREIWNQALMDRLIVRMARHLSPKEVASRSPAVQPAPEWSYSRSRPAQRPAEISSARQAQIDRLRDKARQADQLQRRNERLAEENRTLKAKIKALEAIDQKIQKQKSKIATPGE